MQKLSYVEAILKKLIEKRIYERFLCLHMESGEGLESGLLSMGNITRKRNEWFPRDIIVYDFKEFFRCKKDSIYWVQLRDMNT